MNPQNIFSGLGGSTENNQPQRQKNKLSTAEIRSKETENEQPFMKIINQLIW